MDKIKIGIPRALHYYYDGILWTSFLEALGFEVVVSPMTTREILEQGSKIANDEMCLSLKIYLGHVAHLKELCDYILIPRIDNYGVTEQTCTNFLSLYDIVQNLFDVNIITYNVDEAHHKSEIEAFIKLGMSLGKGREQSRLAYFHSKENQKKQHKKLYLTNLEKLESEKIKLLILSHPYNFEDSYIGHFIQKSLQELNVEMIDGSAFTGQTSKINGEKLSPGLYWKYSKELIGIIPLFEKKVDGILFLSSFPCGPDSLVNELLMRKMKKPHLNLIIDEESGQAGMETRLESFVDILEQKRKVR